jgi:hypothetical protein
MSVSVTLQEKNTGVPMAMACYHGNGMHFHGNIIPLGYLEALLSYLEFVLVYMAQLEALLCSLSYLKSVLLIITCA